MASIHWGIVIDITDVTSDTDASIGLYAGVFYWITGRPAYAGSGYSGEAPASKIWKQGIITSVDRMEPMIRMVKNMEITGGYGNLSGFAVELDDTGGMNTTLESNDYFMINRPADVYCFLDDVSYFAWGGVVSEKNKEGPVIKLVFEDDFKNVHKPMPPQVINEITFPDVEIENIGEIIPITFGNVLRSRVIPVTGKSELALLGQIDPDNTETFVAGATAIDTASDDYRLNIKTPKMDFAASYFKDNGVFYIRVIRGTAQSIRILDNVATANAGTASATTKLVLATMLDGVTVVDFNNDNIYTGSTLSDDLWLFQIWKMDVFYLTSQAAISEYVLDIKNGLEVTRFNRDTTEYNPITELVEDTDATILNNLKHPNIKIINNKMDLSGNITRLIPIVPETIEFLEWVVPGGVASQDLGSTIPNLIDRDRTTGSNIVQAGAGASMSVRYRIKFPTAFVLKGFEKLYLVFDIALQTDNGSFETDIRPDWLLAHYGPYNSLLYASQTDSDYPEYVDCVTSQDFNFMPEEYYKNAGDDNSESDIFGSIVNSVQISPLLLMNENVIADFNNAVGARWAYLNLTITALAAAAMSGCDLTIKQIGFLGMQNINTVQDKIYAKIKGEEILI